jgi:peptidoglycan hydrolase-like protein with peptidoglycan-binding domain
MYEGTTTARRRATIEDRRRRRSGGATTRARSQVARRPDRVALWAVFMAVFAALAAAASSANAGSGGVSGSGGTDPSECQRDADFGERKLRLGDCGSDVKTLNWILKSKRYEDGVSTSREFETPTDDTVRTFQRRAELDTDGIVNKRTRKKLVRSMNKDVATWYGPGFFGSKTACGTKLTKRTVGVAHRRLPCGTKVTLAYGGRTLRTRVIDRGPYAHGARWDLTQKAARKLNFTITDSLRAAAIK